LLTMVALPPLLLSLNCVSPPLFVVMVALAAVLLLLNESTPPLLMMMAAFPAELALLKFRLSLLVKLCANVELLTMAAPVMSKVIPVPLVTKLKTGAPAVNWIVLIEASSEIVTDVGERRRVVGHGRQTPVVVLGPFVGNGRSAPGPDAVDGICDRRQGDQ